MNEIADRKFTGRLIFAVLTGRKTVREAILLFPDSRDKNIECAYHALVHYEADENIRYMDYEYREAQDEYLGFMAQTLTEGKVLPQNIIADYEEYYHGTAKPWQKGSKGFWRELIRFINI